MTSQDATAIILTEAERAELEALARSTKTQYRLHLRAQIVLLAASAMATRAIGCESRRDRWALSQSAGKRMVLAVDEKPSIQALERQGYLKLTNGRALTGQSHQYKRHGTTTLFAAFDVASGKVSGWLSILAGKALSGASFASVAELKAHIEAFIGSYNETAKPFV